MRTTALALLLMFAAGADAQLQFKKGLELDMSAFNGRKVRVVSTKLLTVELQNPKTAAILGTVAIKCDTDGLVDSDFLVYDWQKLIGSWHVRVAGTAKVGGRTVHLFEPFKKEKEKKEDKK